MSSLVVKAIIGEWSGSGLLASSLGMKEVVGEMDSDSVLLSTYTIREGEEYVFRIIIGCGLVLIFRNIGSFYMILLNTIRVQGPCTLVVLISLLFDAFFLTAAITIPWQPQFMVSVTFLINLTSLTNDI